MMNSLICYYQVGHLRRLFDAVLLALSLNVLPPRILELKKLSSLPHCGFQKMYMCPPRKACLPQRKFFQSLVEIRYLPIWLPDVCSDKFVPTPLLILI